MYKRQVVVSEYFLSTYGNNAKIGDTVTLDTESFHGGDRGDPPREGRGRFPSAQRSQSVAQTAPVSYTHLDVYKRQPLRKMGHITCVGLSGGQFAAEWAARFE